MKIVFASMLALSLGFALPAFAAGGTTPGVASPAAHSAPKHKHPSATKQHKPRHKSVKGATK